MSDANSTCPASDAPAQPRKLRARYELSADRLEIRYRRREWAGRLFGTGWLIGWTVGCISFVVHVAIAFHFYHDWSHAHAFERAREDSGIGEGIYLSYAFTGLWIADVAWWWARPRQYAIRPSWIDRSLHAFMLFMVFNSMVVFETGATRWAGLLMFTVLSVAWLFARGWPRRLVGSLRVARYDGSRGPGPRHCGNCYL